MRVEEILDPPAAPRRLMICTGPCCNRTGAAEAFLVELRAKLLVAGDLVGEASCVRRSCLGKCTGEPLAYVEPDGVWYHRLSCESLLVILAEHDLNGRSVPNLIFEDNP